MRKRFRILVVISIVAVLSVLAGLIIRSHEPVFHGKPESYWFTNITYNAASDEIKQWESFGPEGIRFLIRGLNKGNNPLERAYFNTWPKLPSFLRNQLPQPVDATSIRMQSVDMLGRLKSDPKIVVPALVHALKIEKRDSVRMIEIAFFEADILHGMEKERHELLPIFIGAMQSSSSGMRNNAALALRLYPDHADVVAPVLVKGLSDSDPGVCLVSAKSLNQIDPQALVKAGGVTTLANLLKSPDDQIAMRAARSLGEIGKEPDSAIPALLEMAQGTNYNIATSSIGGLAGFKSQAKAAVPFLVSTLKHKDGRMRYAAQHALKTISPETARTVGTK
ncbi:MAG: domain containing protein [Pedosphaera sp.]|nr:domain containing protein [Pedosphaera sp.]